MQTGVLFVRSSNPFLNQRKVHLRTDRNSMSSNINHDDNPLWEKFSIEAVPTLIAFKKGKIISRRDAKMGVGLEKSDLDSILNDLI
jgi:hypothetical protein